MTKVAEMPDPRETVTIPRESFDAIFRTLSEIKEEIATLREVVSGKLPPRDDRLFNSIEAARYCGCTRQTIYAWTRENRIRKVVRHGKVGYLKSDLDSIRRM